MNDRFEDIERLFETALELGPAERAAFLDRECGDDEPLKIEVESLIASHSEAQSFFGKATVEEAIRLFGDDRTGLEADSQIGPYRIIRRIGQGGMGAVYLAERADRKFHYQVSLKVIKRGLDTDLIVSRFLAERQILAGLNHPNIARLFDGGTTEDGRPYFAMEYIEGLRIDNFCDERRLSTAERLKLFREVCSAVEYAHRNLIIHRDLKPGNILVTKEGVPKLLDFGIAKLLKSDSESHTLTQTATAMRMMTPDYASPEQVRGEVVTTASDVYSLGVLLYKLLTGHSPYRFKSQLPSEIERIICQGEPEKPSTAVKRAEDVTTQLTPEKLRRRLSGDLDNMILMAMRKEPDRRYRSVEQLSDDIQRHMEGLPVIARKDTFGYRAGKFIRRNKSAVVAASLILLTLVGGIIATARQSSVATEQRDKARIEAAKAEQVNAFLQRMLSSADPSWYVEGGAKGPEIKVIDVLNEASRRIETELNDQPEIKAEVHLTIGNTYRALGLYDAAERHFQSSLDLRRSILGSEHPDVVESLFYLAAAGYIKGDYVSAEQLYREALAILRANPGWESVYLPHTLSELAGILLDRGNNKSVEPLYRESVELFRKHYGDQHIVIALSGSKLGLIHEDRGELNQALALYQKTLESIDQLPGDPPPDRVTILFPISRIYLMKGDYESAEQIIRQGLGICHNWVGDEHRNYAIGLVIYGEYLYTTGDYAEAEETARKSLEIYRQSLPEGHMHFAQPLMTLGLVLTAKGGAARGEAHIRKALEILNRVKIEGHWTIARAKGALGHCLTAQQRYAEAEPLLIESYESLKSGLGEKHPYTADALKRVIALYQAWYKPDRAERYRARLSRSTP